MRGMRDKLQNIVVIESLKILSEFSKPLSLNEILKLLRERKLNFDSQSLKYWINKMREEGYIKGSNGEGWVITNDGLELLQENTVFERVGEFKDSIEDTLLLSSFDLYQMKGSVPVIIGIINKDFIDLAIKNMYEVSRAGLVLSDLIKIVDETEVLGELEIPPGKIAISVLSSAIYDIIFRNIYISLETQAAGLFKFENFNPRGLVELISHSGTTMSPGLLFLRGNYTSVVKVASEGEGYAVVVIKGVNPRLVDLVERELFLAEARGIRRPLAILHPTQGLLFDKKAKIIFLAGLNFLAPLYEINLKPELLVNEILIDFSELKPVEKYL